MHRRRLSSIVRAGALATVVVTSPVLAASPGHAAAAGRSTGSLTTHKPAVRHSVAAPKRPGHAHPSSAERAVHEAYRQLGKPYRYGQSGPRAFDCSGLTRHAWAAAGLKLPRTSQSQAEFGVRVPVSRIEPGDLVVYFPKRRHVAIYVGSGRVIMATHTGSVVRLAPLYSMPISVVRRP